MSCLYAPNNISQTSTLQPSKGDKDDSDADLIVSLMAILCLVDVEYLSDLLALQQCVAVLTVFWVLSCSALLQNRIDLNAGAV